MFTMPCSNWHVRLRPCSPCSKLVRQINTMFTLLKTGTSNLDQVHHAQNWYVRLPPCSPCSKLVCQINTMVSMLKTGMSDKHHVHHAQNWYVKLRPCSPSLKLVRQIDTFLIMIKTGTTARPCTPCQNWYVIFKVSQYEQILYSSQTMFT
jgi:hypothetical protein